LSSTTVKHVYSVHQSIRRNTYSRGGTKTLWAAFAVSFLLCLWIVPLTTLRAFHRYHDFLTLRGLLVPAVFSVQAVIYGMACWTVWKRKRSARFWAIVASLTYILIPLLTIGSKVHFSRPIRGCSIAVLVVGVTSLIVFSRRANQITNTPNEEQPMRRW
jgi:hypothetical protein